jgi:site-specific recombinase XerD
MLREDKMIMVRPTENQRLIDGYRLCASTEGKSPNATLAVTTSLKYFQNFLATQNDNLSLTAVTRQEIRGFIAYLQQAKRYANHPITAVQDAVLSGHTVNRYVRSVSIFYSWLVSEGVIEASPFIGVKIPKTPVKVIPAFSPSQIEQLLKVIDKTTAAGYRNAAIILTFLDTGIRLTELCTLKMENLQLEDGIGKVQGKGNKERTFPIGKQLQRMLWYYIERCRPEPATPKYSFVFLNHEGKPLKGRMVQAMMKRYGQKAKLTGVRCSPHTLRHTAAISFLRNGGDVFSLQRMLGHSTLEMTRRYCAVTDVDVKRTQALASPVDNLLFAPMRIVKRLENTHQ